MNEEKLPTTMIVESRQVLGENEAVEFMGQLGFG